MAIDFPSNPLTNDTYTVGNKTWRFNGVAWQLVGSSGISGYSGASGYSGVGLSGFSGAGTSGASGAVGSSGISGTSGYSGAPGNPYRTTTTNYSSTVTFNAASNNVFDITLTGNITVGFINGTDAQPVTLRVRQDSVGGRTISFDSNVRLSDSVTSVTLSTAPNKLDYINFRYNSTDQKYDLLAFNLGF